MFLPVGHSHNEVDQRFPSVALALARSEVLETPEARLSFLFCGMSAHPCQDFVQRLQDFLKPAGGRELVIEQAGAWHQWHDYLGCLGASLSGLAILESGQDVSHSMRFIRREDLAKMDGYARWQDQVEARCQGCVPSFVSFWCLSLQDGLPVPAPNDVFLLAKQRMHSKTLSQAPMLVLPASCLRQLPSACELGPCPRNALSATTRREFLKTAVRVALSPWCLGRAAAYLRALVQDNENGEWPAPALLTFVFDSFRMSRLTPGALGLCPELAAFAPGTPRRIQVRFPVQAAHGEPPAEAPVPPLNLPPRILDDDPDEAQCPKLER